MLPNIAAKYIECCTLLNLFTYTTFRASLALLLSFMFCIAFGKGFIKRIARIQVHGQPIREDGPASHLIEKKGTPTMGGLLMLLSISTVMLILGDYSNPYLWIMFLIMISFGLLGFIDDYSKVKKLNTKGVAGRKKLLWQFSSTFLVIYLIRLTLGAEATYTVYFPIFKNVSLNLDLLYYLFGAVVITGASNAVNLTDGLDGLVIVPICISCICFAGIAYVTGNVNFAEYLQVQYIPDSAEVTVFAAAMIGAGMGFFWFNAKPAEIFMGDVGSLSLGGLIGLMSIITKHEITLAIIGGLFVIEAVSVMLQVFCFKRFRRRIFLMAPIHHHFEKKGLAETKIVARFWLVAAIFAVLGLMTLKIR